MPVRIGTAEEGGTFHSQGMALKHMLEAGITDSVEVVATPGASIENARLLGAGALDAMVVPTLMKKGRPGLWLVVIAEPEAADAIARLLLVETSTLGVRLRHDERYELERRSVEVSTAYGAITLKVASLPDGGSRAVPEFESVRAAAESAGRPLREVAEAAMAAWQHEARQPAR